MAEGAPIRKVGVIAHGGREEALAWMNAERLNLHVLAALCEILDCQPGDLIGLTDAPRTRRRAGAKKLYCTLIRSLIPNCVTFWKSTVSRWSVFIATNRRGRNV